MVERENKRKSLSLKYSDLRFSLKHDTNKASSFEEKLEISLKLQSLPRNSSFSRSVCFKIYINMNFYYFLFF